MCACKPSTMDKGGRKTTSLRPPELHETFLKSNEEALTLDPPYQPHQLRDVGLFALVPHGEKNHHGQLPHIYQPRAAEVKIETGQPGRVSGGMGCVITTSNLAGHPWKSTQTFSGTSLGVYRSPGPRLHNHTSLPGKADRRQPSGSSDDSVTSWLFLLVAE